ncbi:helix-turn-helix domain-containing protein [Pelagimonas varians]|uniref:Anaerobic benzoate catabolism transcriptional regulator n=1 Tax=Pelagimonas varians TaxID=696760 RepID=A0A238KYT4_9RHOB|nr:helix-turn-helix transcriptional regulator [Pelagimonas varians]PYG27629.1 helix-turn-helix protein [Pelagimonas varians]SMX47800.1 anaerobic benzoate catabolism transcriptional regulator [Pelagimonas varians]
MTHHADIHVGKRIRHHRWLKGVTQQQLAEAVGIKFQQIQKYETGANRVSASRLWDIAATLDIPVAHFFDGIEDGAAPRQDVDSKDEAQLVADFRRLAKHQKTALRNVQSAILEVSF